MFTSLQKSQHLPGKTTSYFTEEDNAVSITKDDAQKIASPGSVGHGVDFNFSNVSIQPMAVPPAIQTNLSVNTPGDEYEREADDIADRVVETPGPVSVQRRYEEYEQEKGPVRNKSGISPPVSEAVHQTLQSPGHPMDAATLSSMGKRFGYDFGNVKIHSDGLAQKSANDINALAYTSGTNVVFNTNRYSPGSDGGKKLLAHELTHVVQQAGMQHNTVARVIQRQQPPTPTQPTVNPAQLTQQLYDDAIVSITKRTGVNSILLSILKKGKVSQVVPGVYSATTDATVPPANPGPSGGSAPAGTSPAPAGSAKTPSPTPAPAPAGSAKTPVPTPAPVPVVNILFSLEILPDTTKLPQGAFALFINNLLGQVAAIGVAKAGTGMKFPLKLTIITKAPAGQDAADALGEALVHEGTHMLVGIDNITSFFNDPPDPGLTKALTGAGAAFANYQSAAASSPHDKLTDEVKRVHPKDASAPVVKYDKEVKEIVDMVIDRLLGERFAIDQQVAAYPLRVTPNKKSNTVLIDAYLLDILTDETSVNPYPQPIDPKVKKEMVTLLDAVTAKVTPPPQPATPAPGTSTPPAGSSAPQKKP